MSGNKKIIGVTVGTPMSPQRIGEKLEHLIPTVDDELSHTSINPVQNQVVTAALDKKIEQLNLATRSDLAFMFKQRRW